MKGRLKQMSLNKLQVTLPVILLLFFLSGCIDPIEPEFQYKEGLVFIEGFATTVPGNSFISISQSKKEFGINRTVKVQGANVNFRNTLTGQTVALSEEEGNYVPPEDFAVTVGSTWELWVVLPNGDEYRSTPETVLKPVEIQNISTSYESELRFIESDGGKFVPGHRVSVSFNDPENEENFYYWTFRTYENLRVCERCIQGYFRGDGCLSFPPGTSRVPYFDYACEIPCWRIRFPESIAIFEDKFSNGLSVTNLSVGELLLYTKENLVLEIEQFSVTPAAYQYYKVLKDIVDNNSGLNAPPPAALIGNIFDPNDDQHFVFGRFTVAASATASLFLDRSMIAENPLEPVMASIVETFDNSGPPPIATTAPCNETKFRTAIRPEKWITN